MSYSFRTIVVPAASAPSCRALAEGLAGPAGANMWATGLSPSGNAPATHYVSSGMVEDDMLAYLTDAAALSAAGGIPLAQAQALVAAADVSEQAPFDAFARLGPQLIQSE